MATEKQIAANQLNALNSTGPRTAAGKDVSSQNAVKHGLSARKTILLEDENEDEFLDLRQSLRTHFATQDPLQRIFVDTLAAHLWRLQRIPKFEAMLLQCTPQSSADNQGSLPPHDPALQQLLALQEFVLPKDVLGKISRHEAHLLREIQRLLKNLQRKPEQAIAQPPAPPQAQPQTQTQASLIVQPATHANLLDETHQRILNSMNESRHWPG